MIRSRIVVGLGRGWTRLRSVLGRSREKVKDALRSFRVRKWPLPAEVAHRRLILVGASVGLEWRLHLAFPRVRTRVIYAFDKSEAVRRAIEERPDAILIKECAAYFPDDGVDFALVQRWLQMIRAAAIHPVLATVVPVTAAHARTRPGRAEAIWVFNDRLRELAAAEQIPLLDLEATLRRSIEDRYLDERFAQDDGLHLRQETYRRYLDPIIPPLLIKTFCANTPFGP